MAALRHVVAGAAAFGTAVYGGYTWAKASQSLPKPPPAPSSSSVGGGGDSHKHQCCDSGCAFDRLAGVYDDIVGWEEASMFYGLLRWWLLRKAQGAVLELSAGTGRNLPHYPYGSMQSLTLTDVSASMLQQAQRKYFDELQLQYSQPDVGCRFLLADAQRLVAAEGQQPQTVRLPPDNSSSSSSGRRSSSSGPSSSSSSSAAQPAQPSSGSIWRLKQPTSSNASGATAAGTAGTSSVEASSSSPDSGVAAHASSSRGWRWSRQADNSQGPSTSSPGSREGSSSSTNSSSTSTSSTFAPHSFDTVVDTFGLCSCDDPVQVLRQASQLLKPGGKLLLLEHGRGTWDWVNSKLDEAAARHHQTYGCWYNREILQICEQAGLVVESLSRWHFGTSYLIVASPGSGQQQHRQQPHGQGPGAAAAAQAA